MDASSSSSRGGVIREVSAGGVVAGPAGVLMIKVENLQAQIVWTFPKGHLEEGETPEQAALREVQEETGWRCEILGPLLDVEYGFHRNGLRVDKKVCWYRMTPLDRVGEADPEEVLDCRWTPLAEAKALVTYPSDRRIVDRLEKGDF